MLKEAKKKFPKLKVKLGTFLQLPLDAGSVDTVVSSYAFHHCNEEEKYLAVREMARVLRPAGRIVITDLMFADQEAMKKFTEHCSDAEREDLEDECFACAVVFINKKNKCSCCSGQTITNMVQ